MLRLPIERLGPGSEVSANAQHTILQSTDDLQQVACKLCRTLNSVSCVQSLMTWGVWWQVAGCSPLMEGQ